MSIKQVLTPLAGLAFVGCAEHGRTPDPFGAPITGGTMIVSNDGLRAIVADTDRDQIQTVDLAEGAVLRTISLNPGDQPGRLVEDAAGRIHVALRRGGAVATINAAGELIDRRMACPTPRGIAYDSATNSVHVACNTGELVTFSADGGIATRVVRLDRDLRDVIVRGDNLIVTKFRSAEVLTVDRTGMLVGRTSPPTVPRFDFSGVGAPDGTNPDGSFSAPATVAWRSALMPNGSIVMTHQRRTRPTLDAEQPGGYGGGCGEGPVEDGVSVIAPDGTIRAVHQIARAALPVDIAVSRDGGSLAIVAAGNRTVSVVPITALDQPDQDECNPPPPPPPCDGNNQPPTDPPTDDCPNCGGGGTGDTGVPKLDPNECCDDRNFDGRCDDDNDDDNNNDRLGAPTSVAFTTANDVVIFYPEASALVIRAANGQTTRRISLGNAAANDPGRNVFHAQTVIGAACASCHPEGYDDGVVWQFSQFGPRRTQSLGGGILERAPYHWSGDMTNLNVLMDDVFTKRMSGGIASESEKAALAKWLNLIPPPVTASVDVAAAARGKALFESATVGCASCHNGALLTNNQLVNVGTGARFKVPSLLGIGSRAPFMHDGCAKTLTDRFTVCGNSALHGNTAQLSPTQLNDLVIYLESL